MNEVTGKKVAILVAENFEQVEMTEPRKALDQAGVATYLVSPVQGQVQGVNHDQPGDSFKVDMSLSEAKESEFDALLLPGGVMSPDTLRATPEAVKLVQEFYKAGKPIFAICHAPWLLIEAGITKGHQMTSYNSIKTDMVNSGAEWIDSEVVVDEGIVTSRNPDDIPAFNQKVLEELAEGPHERKAA